MEVVEVKYLGSNGQYQTYSNADLSLINTTFITPTFNSTDDYIEYFIKDQAGAILSANYFNSKYGIGSDVNPILGTTSTLTLDPEADTRAAGYNRGIVNVKLPVTDCPDPICVQLIPS